LSCESTNRLGVLAVGDGLGQQALDVAVDLLEPLDVVLVLVLDALEAELGVERALAVDARGHQLAQEGRMNAFSRRSNSVVDVPAGRQIKDDRLDLLLGDGGVGVDLDRRRHGPGGRISRAQAGVSGAGRSLSRRCDGSTRCGARAAEAASPRSPA
jgi:hypothetical protein